MLGTQRMYHASCNRNNSSKNICLDYKAKEDGKKWEQNIAFNLICSLTIPPDFCNFTLIGPLVCRNKNPRYSYIMLRLLLRDQSLSRLRTGVGRLFWLWEKGGGYHTKLDFASVVLKTDTNLTNYVYGN